MALCDRCRALLVTKRSPLTKRQAEILAFVRDYIAAHEYAPSFLEIAEHFDYRTLSTVHEHLLNLERKGRIVREFNKDRSITLVEN